ncbi:hypothetical protein [Thermococcus sp.]|nr:hypothetical protein [Thermococcus sp.]
MGMGMEPPKKKKKLDEFEEEPLEDEWELEDSDFDEDDWEDEDWDEDDEW